MWHKMSFLEENEIVENEIRRKYEKAKEKIRLLKTENDNYAKNIYSALRKADKIKPKMILIEGVKKQGIGYAIMNRLLRTCEHNYFEK